MSSSRGILVIGADSTVCHVDGEAPTILNAEREALLDGTAEVLHGPVLTSEEISYPSLPAFLDEFLRGDASLEAISISKTYPAEVRRTRGPDGHNGAVLTVQQKSAGQTPPRRQTVESESQVAKQRSPSVSLRAVADALECADIPVVIADTSISEGEAGTVRYANAAFCRATGYSFDEIQGTSVFSLHESGPDSESLRRLRKAIAEGQAQRETVLTYKKDGHIFWNDFSIAPLSDTNGELGQFISVQQDVSAFQRTKRLVEAQNGILKKIVTGHPLSEVLSELVAVIEETEPHLLGSVMLTDDGTSSLEHAAGPSLPKDFVGTIDGLNVGPDCPTPGAAYHSGQPLITEDIGQDERWSGHRDAVHKSGLRACWSMPITGSHGDILGAVSGFRSEPGAPSESERSLLEVAAGIAAVAVEYDRQKRARHLQEEQFQRLVENAQPIVFLLDEEGTILISEGEDLRSLGLEPGELVGESIHDLYEDEPILLDYIDRALSGETIDSILKVGGVVFDIWYSPYYDTDGEVAGCIGMAVDITERKKAEEALRFNRDLLRRTQELAGVGGWVYDPQADSMVGTEETYRIYEIPVDSKFTLEESLTFYPPDLEAALKKSAVQCLHEGEPFDLEGSMTGAEGTERWVRIRGEPRRGDEGTIVKMVGTVQDLTERHEMETELRERKRWVQSINENVAGGIYRSTDEGLVYANQAFLDLFGYDSLDEMAATDPRRFYENPDVRSYLIRRGNQEGGIDGMEIKYRRKDGSTFTGLLRSRRVESEGDQPTYYDGVVTDITEQKAREQKFRQQREKIEAVYESSGRLLEAQTHRQVASILTSVLAETFGYPEVNIRCLHDDELVPIASHPPSLIVSSLPASGENIVAEIYRSGETRVYEETERQESDSALTRDRARAGVPLSDYGILTLTGTDQIGDFDLRLINILAQKGTAVLGRIEHETQLRDSEERFRGLFEEAAAGIALIDPDGIILEANPALTAMFAPNRGDLPGHRFPELAHPEQRDSLEQGIRDLIDGERSRYEIEQRYVRDNDSVFWGRLTVSQHKGPGEAEAICMIEDISSRKQYEQGLKEAKEEAEEASRLKSALLANMSHEIRTPLTSIIGFAGILKDNLSGSNAEYARLAHEGGERLMDTLDSVLQLSKLEAGVIEPSAQQMDLVEVARRTVELARPEADSADLALEFESNVDTLSGRWTPTAVQRVLSNLLRNAIKFTPKRGTVTVRVRASSHKAVLEVEDTGVGISDEFRPRLFDAFTQESEGLKRAHEGSGLGLAIVSRLVDLLQGDIHLESTKGEGTCFTVALPLND